MTEREHQGDALGCERCGGALPARQLAETLTCPHCGHSQRIDAAALAALEGYRDEAARDLSEADAHRADARELAGQKRRMARGQLLVMVMVAPMMIATVFVVVIPVLHGAGLYDWNAMAAGTKTIIGVGVAFISILGGLGVGALAFFIDRRRGTIATVDGAKPAPAPAVLSIISCPRCGGPNELQVGVATEECIFCHGTFAANEAVRVAGLDASERARRAAALERYRKERVFIAGYGSQNQDNDEMPTMAIAAILPAVFGPILCIGSGFGAVQNLSGAESNDWLGVIGGGVGGVVLLVLAVVFGWLTREKMQRGRGEVVERARAYGGTPFRGLMATARWLSEHWAGPFELELLHGASAGYLGAEGWIAGYPWLFELQPSGGRARAQVFVAAFYADTPDPTLAEDTRQTLATLKSEGAAITVGAAGLRAELRPADADPRFIQHLRDRMVFVAARLGGRPLR